jgi:hypothetical protein
MAYKVIGTDAAMLVYLTDHFYDPEDEGASRTTNRTSPTIGNCSISKLVLAGPGALNRRGRKHSSLNQ